MTNFTKEELEVITYCFENISQRKFFEDKNIQPLYLKIQSMIDNYCEQQECQKHESDCITSSGIISSVEGDIYTPFKCKHCGEYFNDN